MPEPVLIRKYENRRLYDTDQSRYVSLPDIAEIVRSGREVRVVDAKSGEDLTRLTLTQIILDEARQKRGELPLEVLRQIILSEGQAFRELFRFTMESALAATRVAMPFAVPPAPKEPPSEDLVKTIQALRERIEELERRSASPDVARREPGKKIARLRRAPRR